MIARRTLTTLTLGASALAGFAGAQEPAKIYGSLDELRASYSKQSLDLDRRRIADLTALAAKQAGDQAEPTYRELFGLAVARDFYAAAEPAAVQYLKTGSMDPQDRALAALVVVIAQADRGEHDRSLASLADYMKQNPIADDPARRLEPGTAIAVGEAYLQRLLRGGRYDIARKACEMVVARRPEPEIRDHFTSRLARLGMLGKPAPEVVGRDVDGKPIRLSDLKGKVVLVDFWATWCPPCLAAFPELQALQAKYGKDGFLILGVNLDAHRNDVEGIEKAAPVVKQFLLNARASWPNILVGEPQKGDPADLFGVDEIPASFLIDRQGTIVHVELSGEELDKAVAKAIKP